MNPNDATAHHWYSFRLAACGHFDEATWHMRRSLKLDPLSPVINSNFGRVLFWARRYGEAIDQAKKALELESNFFNARFTLGRAYTQTKMYPEALAQWGTDDFPLIAAFRGYTAALSGDKRAALKEVEGVKRSGINGIELVVALVYTGLGEVEQALDWLEQAYESREIWLIFVNVDPEFDPLRSHPRFKDLLKRLNLADDSACGQRAPSQ